MNKEISEILNLTSLGNYAKALIKAEDFYKKNKTSKDAIKLLANIHFLMDNYESASSTLSNFIINNSENVDFECYNNLGLYFLKQEEYEKALENLNKAISIKFNQPQMHINLAEVNLALRKFDEAEKNINQSLQIFENTNIDNSDLLSTIIHIYCSINTAMKNNDHSIKLIDQFLQKKFNEDLFYEKVSIDPKSVHEHEITQAKQKVLEYDQTIKIKQHRFKKILPLLFGIAKYYEKKEKSESESYYDLGNREVFNILRYNSYNDQKSILNIIEIYENKFEKINLKNLHTGEHNFFIVGSPRSGTTLTESIITANEDVFAAGELRSMTSLMENYILKKNIDKEEDMFTNINEISKRYTNRTNFIKQNYQFVIDKLPGNYLYLGFLQKIFPKCKIVRTFREPWDTAISLYVQRYVQNIPYSSSFFNIGVFMANFEAINIYWDKKLDKKRILDLKYEDLVRNEDEYQKKLYDFLGISSKYNSEKRASFFSKTASTHQVQKDVYSSSIKKADFINHKSTFIDSYLSQREYWISRGITPKESNFFGYSLS